MLIHEYEESNTVCIELKSSLLAATSPWGVQVERVEVKDVRLPVQLQRAMATEAEAAREARAKVIAAEGEKKASYALKDAALVISQTPTAIQLRYLQTLTTIAAEHNSTIVRRTGFRMCSNQSCELFFIFFLNKKVFPIPLELLSFLQIKQHEHNQQRLLSHSNTQAMPNETIVNKIISQQFNDATNNELTLKQMSTLQSEI